MKQKYLILASVLGLVAVAAHSQTQPNMDDVMKAMGAMLGGSTNAASVVDFREIKALLPADLTGLKRASASGEKSGAMGMTVAYAEGRYSTADGNGTITIKISDMGGTGAMMNMMSYGWASTEIDRETDTGYERTTTIAGNKAKEQFDTANQSGETQVLVNKRFLVEVHGNGVTAEQIKEAVSKIDLAKLATLKPKPAAPAP